jgi:hypothetical protein
MKASRAISMESHQSFMMEAETGSETLENPSILIRLIARENFVLP